MRRRRSAGFQFTIRSFLDEWTCPEPNSGCYLWTRSVDSYGYGHVQYNGRLVLAHRLSWELANGISPGKAHVLHSCDTPPCCNPMHLALGSHLENMRDALAKGRAARLAGSANGRAILTPSSVNQIRETYRNGELRQKDIAALYGIGQSHVSRIVREESWKL